VRGHVAVAPGEDPLAAGVAHGVTVTVYETLESGLVPRFDHETFHGEPVPGRPWVPARGSPCRDKTTGSYLSCAAAVLRRSAFRLTAMASGARSRRASPSPTPLAGSRDLGQLRLARQGEHLLDRG